MFAYFLADFSLNIQYQLGPQNILPDIVLFIILAPLASGNAPSPGGDVGMLNTLVLQPSCFFFYGL